MDAVNVNVRPDGNYQVGNETVKPDQFDAKLEQMKADGFAGNFKLGDALSMDLAGVKNLFSAGPQQSTELTLKAPANASGASVNFDPGAVDKKLGTFAQLMSDVFKLIAENASTERKSSREGRHAAQAAEQADLSSQVEKMKDAASKAFEGALIQGIVGIASGAVTAVISVVSAGISIAGSVGNAATATAKGAGTVATAAGGVATKAGGGAAAGAGGAAAGAAGTAAKTASGAAGTASAAATKAAVAAKFVEGIGGAATTATKGAGEIGKGAKDMEADQLRAEGTQAEANARMDSAMAQDENEFMQNYMDMQREIRQKMSGIIEAQNATLNALARA